MSAEEVARTATLGLLPLSPAALVAGVAGLHRDDRRAHLVAREVEQAGEGPRVQTTALPPASLHAGLDACPALECQRGVGLYRLGQTRLADVVALPSEAFLAARRLTQAPPGQPCAFRLQAARRAWRQDTFRSLRARGPRHATASAAFARALQTNGAGNAAAARRAAQIWWWSSTPLRRVISQPTPQTHLKDAVYGAMVWRNAVSAPASAFVRSRSAGSMPIYCHKQRVRTQGREGVAIPLGPQPKVDGLLAARL